MRGPLSSVSILVIWCKYHANSISFLLLELGGEWA